MIGALVQVVLQCEKTDNSNTDYGSYEKEKNSKPK